MCGICGAVDFQGLDQDIEQRLGAMIRSLRHRGPDASGWHIRGPAALGHARLSIIDLAGGQQPIANEDRTVWVIVNGEIYNYRQLRDDLLARGHRFASSSDSEVLVHLYEQHGIDAVNRLRGMFAAAIWDSRAGEMYLLRDRLGIKPLYYTIHNGRLIFGSEIKAILAHGGVARSVREDALSDYLTFLYVPGPKTILKGVYKLQGGHWLRFSRSELATRQYWDLSHRPGDGGERKDLEDQLIARLQDAVTSHLACDVPLGAFLSGGVDSSAVVAMMARAGCRPLITTSVGFTESAYNELPAARATARRFGADHHERVVTARAAELVERLAWHYDEPFADYSSLPTYCLSQQARGLVTVALSGDGGDENFGGYRRYRMDLIERRVRRLLPAPLRRWVLGPMAWLYPKADWLPRPLRAKTTLGNLAVDPASAYCRSVGFLSDAQKPAFLDGDVARLLSGYRSADIIAHHMRRAAGGDLDALLYTDIKTYLVDDILTKVDRASMAVSLEVRVPLLDHEFVEFAASIPWRMKIDRDGQKSIFKSALRGTLDDETLNRPKQGFTPPLASWLRGPLREMMQDLLLTGRAAYGDYLRPAMVRRACRQHMMGLRDYAGLLWAVLMFETWARRFLTAGEPEPSAESVA